MPAGHIARRLLLAGKRPQDPLGLWRLLTMSSAKLRRDPNARNMVPFLESRYGREPRLRDPARIMARALNEIFGDGTAEESEGKLWLAGSRAHHVVDAFTNPEDTPDMTLETLWNGVKTAADAHMREQYGASPRSESESPADTPSQAEPEQGGDSPAEQTAEAPEPQQRGHVGEMALVANDPELWNEYMQFGEGHREYWEGVAEDPEQFLVVRVGQPGFVEQGRSQKAEAAAGRPLAEMPVLVSKDRLRLPDGSVVPVRPSARPVPQPDRPESVRPDLPAPPRPEPVRDESVEQPTVPDESVEQPTVSGDTLEKMSGARDLLLELMSIRPGSIEGATGVRFEPWKVRAVYDELDGVLSQHGRPMRGEPAPARDYVPADEEMLRRLYLRLHGVLGARRELDAANVNPVAIKYLARDLADLSARRSASCDVSRRGALTEMCSAEGDSVCDGRNKAASIAADLLKKQAIQLSKGNMRADKNGTITIDPGFMNCPVVRAVIRDLDTKASDMEALRQRLDDMGMIVTQSSHGQCHVYCVARTESGGAAKTRLCQWFIDAHGADGKFKIECAKD